jgi:hypothetical protein
MNKAKNVLKQSSMPYIYRILCKITNCITFRVKCVCVCLHVYISLFLFILD